MRIRKKVLVVNDDKLHLYKARDLLESDEIEVVTHTSAFGVTSLVRLMHPDLILLDINMMALSGNKLASLIRDYCDFSCIPVIFHSLNDESILLESVTATGVPGYTWKANPADLRIKIKRDISRQAKKYREVRAREFTL